MNRRCLAAAGALLCAAAGAACHDVPLLPKWDADWVIPLPSQTISFPGAFGSFAVPPKDTVPISFPPVSQSLSGGVGNLFADPGLLRSAKVVLELRKTTALAVIDTVFVGEAPDALVNGNPRTIQLRLDMTTSDTMVVDTLVVTSTNFQMLTDVTNAKSALWLKLSGIANSGATPVVLTSADQLSARIQLVATVGVSH